MIGTKLGRLTVIERSVPRGDKITRYLCRCDCGNEKDVMMANLLNPRGTRSCGCSRSPLDIRGLSGDAVREYQIFKHMLARCSDHRLAEFARYGGRGISVCERWRTSFATFLADMGRRPSPLHTLDREDVNGNYEPGNCRWATMKEQNNNRRDNRRITMGGTTLTLSQWSDRTALSAQTIRNRLRAGWSVDRALSSPSRTTQYKGRILSG